MRLLPFIFYPYVDVVDDEELLLEVLELEDELVDIVDEEVDTELVDDDEELVDIDVVVRSLWILHPVGVLGIGLSSFFT